jgi:hypothetical protein
VEDPEHGIQLKVVAMDHLRIAQVGIMHLDSKKEKVE